MNLGFIGAGRMATALAKGCVEARVTSGASITASDPQAAAREIFAQAVEGAHVTPENQAVLASADAVVLAVKPQTMPEVLADLRPHAEPRHLFISIAAGVTLARIAAALPAGARIVRVMPNTPCLVGLGSSCYSRGVAATSSDALLVEKLLSSVGSVHEVEETKLDAVTGLSGSGPAFVYTMIEALADGGVAAGLPEQLALKLAAETARGAAAMLLATGRSPAELREQVASPGGTTVAGLAVLERLDAAAAVRAAVEAAAKRSIELGQSPA